MKQNVLFYQRKIAWTFPEKPDHLSLEILSLSRKKKNWQGMVFWIGFSQMEVSSISLSLPADVINPNVWRRAAAATAAVSASQGRGCSVLPGSGEAAVRQSASGLQRLPRHHEGVQVTDVGGWRHGASLHDLLPAVSIYKVSLNGNYFNLLIGFLSWLELIQA